MRSFRVQKTATRMAAVASLLIASAAFTSAGAEPAEPANGARYRAIQTFEGARDGSWPAGGLVGDPKVALFGITNDGGRGAENANGTVYRLKRTGTEGWRHDVIFDRFNRKNGIDPYRIVSVGDRLIGATHAGGELGAGVMFELRKAGKASKDWEYVVLHAFSGGEDGTEVQSLTVDPDSGTVYGATSRGGDLSCGFGDGCGVIFALKPKPKGDGWSYEVIHRFVGGASGWRPWGDALTFSRGALYGTTHFGGVDCEDDSPYNFDCGTVYRLDPPAKAGGDWAKTLLYSFEGKQDGARPSSSLVVRGGAIYGTTIMAGSARHGTVFKVTPKETGADFALVHTALRNQFYLGGLAAGADGVLYATGENKSCAETFSLTPAGPSEPYAMLKLKALKEINGCFPDDSLRFVASENMLLGMTWDGGEARAGTIYRLKLPEPPTQ